jgi:hypothetical protein
VRGGFLVDSLTTAELALSYDFGCWPTRAVSTAKPGFVCHILPSRQHNQWQVCPAKWRHSAAIVMAGYSVLGQYGISLLRPGLEHSNLRRASWR